MTVDKLENIRLQIKEDLCNSLVAKELFEERLASLNNKTNAKFDAVDEKFNSVDVKFKILNFKFNILIALTIAALTLANPAFVKIIEKLF